MSTDEPAPPSPNGPNGERDTHGRFIKGNPGGPGNPHARQVALLRSEMLKTVTPQDMREVIAGLLSAAKEGDVAAAKLLLDRLLGRVSDRDAAAAADIAEKEASDREWLRGEAADNADLTVLERVLRRSDWIRDLKLRAGFVGLQIDVED